MTSLPDNLFQDYGRLAPEGLQYLSSWVDEKLERCFQLMEASDLKYIDEWIANWSDIVEFEVYPVISSKEAAERVLNVIRKAPPISTRLRVHNEDNYL